MNFNLSQIQSVTFGAARVTEEADGFHFYRFTKHQEDIYQLYSTDFYRKTFAGANIRLEFTTDSQNLEIEALFEKASSRSFAFIDVYCNENAIAHIGSATSNHGLYGDTLDLGEGEKNVRIYLPWSSSCVIRSVRLDDGASLIPAKKTRKMLIFGDSITQGYDALYPSHSYASILADRLNADARNKGIGGDVFYPALLDEAEDMNPDLITVAYGTNDWSKAKVKGEVEEVMKEYYSRLSKLYPNAKIFALCPIWRKDELAEKPTGRFADLEPMLRRTTEALSNVTVIPGYDNVPHDPTYFSDLYLHPNDAGFAFYAEHLLAKLLPLL